MDSSGSTDPHALRETLMALNRLIETCKDSERGFHTAGKETRNEVFRKLFGKFEQQRARFADELQEAVRQQGTYPTEDGSLLGSLHSQLVHVSAVLEGDREHAILRECVRGERLALRHFDDALEESLPNDVEQMVRRQAKALSETVSTLRKLYAAPSE